MSSSDLFRAEALLHRQQRLMGQVEITSAPKITIVTAALSAVGVAAMVWASLAELARTTYVDGMIVTTIPVAKVYGNRPGRVEKVFVREGQWVKKGDRIALVSTEQSTTSGTNLSQDERQQIESDIQTRVRQDQVQAAFHRSENLKARLEIEEDERNITSLRGRLIEQRSIVNLLSASLERYKPVLDRGFVSRTQYESNEQRLYTERQRQIEIEQSIDATINKLARDKQNLISMSLSSQDRHSNNRLAVSESKRQLVLNGGQTGYMVIAPTSGRITALSFHQWKEIQPTISLLSIVPENAVFEAECFVPSTAIGLIAPKQAASIHLDAFPYQRFGIQTGKIRYVSAAPSNPAEIDAPFELKQTVYKTRISLTRQHVMAFGKEVSLTPGMTLKAAITTSRFSLIDWLLEPFNAARMRS